MRAVLLVALLALPAASGAPLLADTIVPGFFPVGHDAPGACPEAEGSLVAGTREVRVSWVAQASGRVAVVVHPGLVAEETPYALDLRVDDAPADARLDVDDATVVAWPWVAACRV